MRTILGHGGIVRGYIRETANGQTLYAPGGRVLGYYNETANQTTDAGGRLIGYGNLLLILLED